MTSAVGVSRAIQRLSRLRPDQVRAARFARTRFGRRGLAEDQVYAFVRRMVDELIARDAVEAGLREENIRLKEALRAWHEEQSRTRPGNAGRWTDRQRHS
ncbi:DivIVA domain-containing protein [Micromonospora pisi]|uniref:DivIVA domain-containing protein n=1 Tax=Micromonospora pisi TaxID=589240 RepID=UPI001FEC17B3|nr:DivIVA domain-containing protein [Micromonospora pisi]